MLILAEEYELFLTCISGQPESLRSGAEPLPRDALTGGVVSGLQMLPKVFASVGKFPSCLMRQHEAEENAIWRSCLEKSDTRIIEIQFLNVHYYREHRVFPADPGDHRSAHPPLSGDQALVDPRSLRLSSSHLPAGLTIFPINIGKSHSFPLTLSSVRKRGHLDGFRYFATVEEWLK